MINLFIEKADLDLLKRAEIANKNEMLSWKLPNLIFPIVVIVFSLISFLIFKNSGQKNFIAFINLLLNGSLPMVALNRLSSLGVNLFKFNSDKEKIKSKKGTYNLRLAIHYYSMALVFGIAMFYCFQVINIPFDLCVSIFFQILLGVFCIHQALQVSKYAFLLQEKLMDITFDSEIRVEIEEKGHGKNW